MRRSVLAVLCLVSISLIPLSVSLSYGQSGGGFPAAHAELLGAASFAALFGQVAESQSSSAGPPPPTPPDPGRPPRISPNVRVNAPQVLPPTGRIGRSETTLAVGGEGKFIVVGFNTAEGFLRAPFAASPSPGTPGLSGFGFSTDHGQTFTDGGVPFVAGVDPNNPTCGNLVTRGDPWLDIRGRGNGTVYYANLAVHQSRTCFLSFNGFPAGVTVHRGSFSGQTFAWNDVRLLQSPGFPNDFYDKEALATDKNGSRPFVYISLTNFKGFPSVSTDCAFAGGFGQIEIWSALDGGNIYFGPTVVQPDQTDLSDTTCLTGRENQGSQPAVGPDGEVYVAWRNGPDFVNGVVVTPLSVRISVARSDDFGATFAAPVTVASINSIERNPPDGYNRSTINDFPRIAVAQSGPFRGRVYVAFQSAPSAGVKRSNVFVSFSDDKGETWNTPVRIGTPLPAGEPTTPNVLRFWPVPSIGTDGNVEFVYYESVETNLTPSLTDRECRPPGRSNPGQTRSSLVNLFWAESIDGGAMFEAPIKVTTVTSNWCKARTNIIPNFGDYFGATSFGNRVFVTWADGRLPTTADTLPAPAGPRDRTNDTFYSTINTIGRAPR